MIRTRKIEMKFRGLKDAALKDGMPEDELAERLQMIEAEKDLEIQLSNQHVQRDREEREQKLRENLEENFFKEKKDQLERSANLKRFKLN